MVSDASPWRIDFVVRVDEISSRGDVNEVGDPLAGLSVSDTVSGSFVIEVPQPDQDINANRGRYNYTDLVLNLPTGPAISLDLAGRPGFEFGIGPTSDGTFDIEDDDLFSLSAVIQIQELDYGVGDTAFDEQITLDDGPATPLFDDVNVLDPVELAEEIVGSNLGYSYRRLEGATSPRGAFINRELDAASFDGELISVTATLVPEPGSLALLAAGGLLVARRRR
ncbi:MAG: PEP-CTERM sorting domain-containing protein [Planctomycetota bacterium]